MKFRDLMPDGMWIEEELSAALAAETQKEIDKEIMEDLMRLVATMPPNIPQK